MNDPRLTWDKRFPYPYESIWSIVTKVAIYNGITLSELLPLIKTPYTKKWYIKKIDLFDTRWIDFDKLGALLDVDAARIYLGSLTYLEIAPPQSSYMVRQCPKCWAAGYHCVLFDCALFSSCPFHGCDFTRPCDACALQGFKTQPLPLGSSVAHHCSKCGLAFPNRSRLLAIADEHALDRKELEKMGSSFTKWWHRIGRRFNFRDDVLGDLVRAPESMSESLEFLPWKLYYAEQLAMEHIPLKSSLVAEAAHYAELTYTSSASSSSAGAQSTESRIGGSVGRSYRSLRAHIYKRYIRPHSSCYKKLKRLSYSDGMYLNYDNVCLACLSYVIWRMSIERLVRIEGLSYARPGDFALKLAGPIFFEDFSPEDRLRWAHFFFLSIWKALDSLRGRANVRIEYSDFPQLKDLSSVDTVAQTAVLPDNSEVRNGVCCILFPDIKQLAENELERCRDRKKKASAFPDLRYNRLTEFFMEKIMVERSREIMFELKSSENLFELESFLYIYV